MRTPLLAAVTSFLLLAPLALASTSASAAPTTPVVINEVESSDGNAPDWIELKNTGVVDIDLSGYILKDSGDKDAYTFAAGVSIAAGAYLVVDPAFGLGGGDSARLFAADGSTVLDSYTWSTHATTTYGRCADGVGDFTTTVAPTRGAANACVLDPAAVVRINEVESSAAGAPDWVELKNTGSMSVDVAGLMLKDSGEADPFTFPANSTIAAGGYLAVDVPFGLGGGDSARFLAADGTTVIDSYTWTAHASATYGRCPDGVGSFATTTSSTKAAVNDCAAPSIPSVRINEVESSGGTPGDWAELFNFGSTSVDVSGWVFKDSEDTHAVALPAGTIIAPGGFFVIEEAFFGNGLGAADSARLFLADGVTPVDSRSWTAHAATTYGICGTDFVTTGSATKGAANDCASAPLPSVAINEIESSGDVPDWIELKNTGATAVNLGGFVLKDNGDKDAYTFAAGTTLAAGAYLVVDPVFGLGGGDSARLFAADGTTIIDSYSWTAHAATTYGRCPDGTGAFATTTAPTRGTVNACAGDLVTAPWPGGPSVTTVDPAGVLGGNMSGLFFDGDVLWAVKNGPGTLYRLVKSGSQWVPDTTQGWAQGKPLHYPNGQGDVDAEGVTVVGGAIFVASERNNSANGVSRPAVLRFDPTAAGASLTASMEFNLTPDLPGLGANLGLEAIGWVPDSVLTGKRMIDESTGAAYNPDAYANHGGGLFFVGVEATGTIYAYALNQATGGYSRVAAIASGFPGVMEVQWDPERGVLWAVCDDTCNGRSATLAIAPSGSTAGRFGVTAVYERPAGMPNINNEGFAIAPQSQCVGGSKAVLWADDSNTAGNALRAGTINCTVLTDSGPTSPIVTPVNHLAATGSEPVAPLAVALLLLLVGALVLAGRRVATRAPSSN